MARGWQRGPCWDWNLGPQGPSPEPRPPHALRFLRLFRDAHRIEAAEPVAGRANGHGDGLPADEGRPQYPARTPGGRSSVRGPRPAPPPPRGTRPFCPGTSGRLHAGAGAGVGRDQGDTRPRRPGMHPGRGLRNHGVPSPCLTIGCSDVPKLI